MALASRITACFALSASALVGASVVLLYDQFAPARTAQVSGVDRVRHHRGQASGDEAATTLGMPIVLPPSVARTAVEPVTRAFERQCVEAARLGLPSSGEVRCYGGYIARLNLERRVPDWVLERLSVDVSPAERDGKGDVSRTRSRFFADATVPSPFRVAPDDYTTRGLSRGHLAAARFHKHSQEEMDNTFNMNANMVPQDMTANAMDWERLESLTQRLRRELAHGPVEGRMPGKRAKAADSTPSAAASSGRHLFVVSGPVFMPQEVHTLEHWANGTVVQAVSPARFPPSSAPRRIVQYELTGKNNTVAVPTHLFKVLLAETCPQAGGRQLCTYEAAAFLLPNRAIPEEKPLTAYQVPVRSLEQVTGLSFFSTLGKPIDALPNLCATHQCDSRPAALFAKYREVAQLRVATSVPELRQTYAQLQSQSVAKGGNGTLDSMVEKEFQSRTAELVAESARAVDRD